MPGYRVGPALPGGVAPFREGWERSAEVAACDLLDRHDWETVLVRFGWHNVEEVVRCASCRAPRCGSARDDDPCMRIRHHRDAHRRLSGKRERVGA